VFGGFTSFDAGTYLDVSLQANGTVALTLATSDNARTYISSDFLHAA
jgi:hypothetical protein